MPNLYKLWNDAKPAELDGPPIILGSARRVPSYAYPNWGIEGNVRALYPLSLMAYQDEFLDTSPAWMESVIEAANRGGLGDRPNMLRNNAADIATKLTYEMLKERDKVYVLDVGCGAGGSAIAYLNALEKFNPSFIERVHLTCVDLSRQNMLKAIDTLKERGFDTDKNLDIVYSRDTDMTASALYSDTLNKVKSGSQDIVINVAGIHANAYLEPAMYAISNVLRHGTGYLVSGDWHHARWEHPSWAYQLFDEMDPEHFEWKNKGEFMDEFIKMFPKAEEKLDLTKMNPADIRAIEEIGKYWRDGWAEVRLEKIKAGLLKPTDEQIALEGHRPVERYIEVGRQYNLTRAHRVLTDGIMHSNPQQAVSGSNLNMLLVLREGSTDLFDD